MKSARSLLPGRSGGEWMIPEKAEILPPGPKGAAALSYRELKSIYSFSLSLTRNVDEAHIREMILRGFFSKGIAIHEREAEHRASDGPTSDLLDERRIDSKIAAQR
jgi:hypothetical protein